MGVPIRPARRTNTYYVPRRRRREQFQIRVLSVGQLQKRGHSSASMTPHVRYVSIPKTRTEPKPLLRVGCYIYRRRRSRIEACRDTETALDVSAVLTLPKEKAGAERRRSRVAKPERPPRAERPAFLKKITKTAKNLFTNFTKSSIIRRKMTKRWFCLTFWR